MLISCLDLVYTLVLFLGTFNLIKFLFRMEPIKSFEAPTPIFSASLHPSKSCFVAGGDDFKLYKFDYGDGKELGKLICIMFYVFKISLQREQTDWDIGTVSADMLLVCYSMHWWCVGWCIGSTLADTLLVSQLIRQ